MFVNRAPKKKEAPGAPYWGGVSFRLFLIKRARTEARNVIIAAVSINNLL